MAEILKIIFGLTIAALLALVVLYGLGAFEMPWFEEVYSRTS